MEPAGGVNWDAPMQTYSQQPGGYDYGYDPTQTNEGGVRNNVTGGEYSTGGYQTQSANAQSPEDDDDLPLLEELGINPQHIKDKALSVLNPFKIKNTDSCREYIEDEDLAGPLCFALLLGFAMMLGGKMHFGHIYGTFYHCYLFSIFQKK